MKNLTRKLLTVLMAVALVFTSVNTVKAVQEGEQGKLTVEGLEAGDVVRFYKIVDVTYAAEDAANTANKWTYAQGYAYSKTDSKNLNNHNLHDDLKALTYDVSLEGLAADGAELEKIIPALANAIADGKIVPLQTSDPFTVADGKTSVVWEKTDTKAGPEPGIYIAVVTARTLTAEEQETKDAIIYNPALLSLVYNTENENSLDAVTVNMLNKYQPGVTLKSSQPGSDKAIVGGEGNVVYDGKKESDTFDEDADWEQTPTDAPRGAKTVSLGDEVKYEAQIDIPEYPVASINKTLWFNDTMEKGLTFNSEFFSMKLKQRGGDNELEVVADGTNLKVGDVVIGQIKFTEGAPNGGFSVNMDYEALRGVVAATSNDPATAPAVSTYFIRLDYSAIVNEHAVVGSTGNKNKLTYVYANNPNKGSTNQDIDGPSDEAEGNKKREDEEIVYTYEILIKKVDVNDETVLLPNAEFDVYDGPKATGNLIGHIKTNENGVATLSVVAAGKYYLYETAAPDGGYTYDPEQAWEVEANWTSCTWSNSQHEEKVRYTSDSKLAYNDEQVGWIRDGLFYERDAYGDAFVAEHNAKQDKIDNPEERDYILPAYVLEIKASESTTSGSFTNTDNAGAGAVIKTITNSKTPTLPSTGGVGTYIFTIAGVAILATAAFMLIFRKREDA